MSGLRSVLLLCWRDTGHPQGGGSEAYLQRIGAQLAASGIEVTLRTARYPGARRREVIDGMRIIRAGGRYSVYVWALLAMAVREMAARFGLGSRPDVVVDTPNGLPFLARLVPGRRVVVLVHHGHREQWPVAGPVLGRLGWFVESTVSPRGDRHQPEVQGAVPVPPYPVPLGGCARPADSRALAAGPAKADRRRARGGRAAAAAGAGAAPRHRRRRLVAPTAHRPRATARDLGIRALP